MKLMDIIIWILVIIAAIMVFWYIFGDTPNIEQTLLIFILGFVIVNYASIRVLRNDHNNLKKSFSALARDFKDYVKK